MAWVCYRQATSEDRDRLQAAARRFIYRHSLRISTEDDTGDSLALSIDLYVGGYERRLWLRCARRALRHPQAEGIAWGHVGRSVE